MSKSQVGKNSGSEDAVSGRDGRESRSGQDKEEADFTDIANTSSGKRSRCSICNVLLENCRPYYRRYRTCPECAAKDSVMIAGKPHRFCQQCGKFQERHLFDGVTRTCRDRLSRHAERRRNAAERKREREKRAKAMPSETPPAEPLLEKKKVSNNVDDVVAVVHRPGQKRRGSAFRSLQPSSNNLQVVHPMLYATEMRTENRPAIHRPRVLRFNASGPYGEEERGRAYAILDQILDGLGIFQQVRQEAGFVLPQSRTLKNIASSPKIPSAHGNIIFIPRKRDMDGLNGKCSAAVPVVTRTPSTHSRPTTQARVAVIESVHAEQPSILEADKKNGDVSEAREERNDQTESQVAAVQLLEHALGLADKSQRGRIRDIVLKIIDSSEPSL